MKVTPGRYRPRWFDPRTGAFTTIAPSVDMDGPWTSPPAPDGQDWALLVRAMGQ